MSQPSQRQHLWVPMLAAAIWGNVALGDDAHIVFERQNAGCASPEDDLVIGNNDAIHRNSPAFCGIRKSHNAFIGADAL